MGLASWFKKSKALGGGMESLPASVVVDLDDLLTRNVAFRWNGEVYTLPPLELHQFLGATNQLAVLDEMRTKKVLTEPQLIKGYFDLFKSMGIKPEIPIEKVRTMHQQQIAALFNLVVECIMGKAQIEAEKKSLPQAQMPNQVQA